MIDVKKAKQKILDLAIRGKLTKQLKFDGNAADLFVEIQKEKEKQNTGARATRQCISGANSENPNDNNNLEVPFEIPENWVWCRFDDIYEINPEVIANKNDKAAFIPMERISAGYENKCDYLIQDWSVASKAHTRFCDGDVCFAKISPCFENRKSFIANNLPNGIGGGTTELIVIRQKKILKEFTYLIVLDERFIFECSKSYKGVVGQQRIKKEILDNYLVPLPPFAEQKRIVEKVEQLFDILDKIDEAQKKYKNDKEILKTKIIEAGIRGKLTKQFKSDGDAKDLLDEIRKEKEKLIKEGKIKRDKKETYIYKNLKDNLYYEKYQDGTEKCINDELPFEIPDNWVWCRASQLLYLIAGTSYNKADIKSDGIRILRGGNIVANQLILFDDDLFISDTYQDEAKNVYKGDIIFVASTGSKITIGKPARILVDYHKTQIGAFLRIARMYENCISNYLWLVFNSSYYKNHILKSVKGTSISNIKNEHIEDMLIPFPPFVEQGRIVEQIEELLRNIVS